MPSLLLSSIATAGHFSFSKYLRSFLKPAVPHFQAAYPFLPIFFKPQDISVRIMKLGHT